MTHPLLKEFLQEELSGLDANEFLARFQFDDPSREAITLHFNRFNVLVKHRTKEVLIEDDLDVSQAGTCTVAFSEFDAAIRDTLKRSVPNQSPPL